MTRKMSIARQIKIQKLQTKNRMVGQTFNPSGHTSESLQAREQEYINKVNNMTSEERKAVYEGFVSIENWKAENNIHCSNDFEHNAFMRNFKHLFN
jgi:hypothetical protein